MWPIPFITCCHDLVFIHKFVLKFPFWEVEQQRGNSRSLVFGGRKKETKEEETGAWDERTAGRRRSPWGPKTDDKQRKLISEDVACGEQRNLKARDKPQDGAADERRTISSKPCFYWFMCLNHFCLRLRSRSLFLCGHRLTATSSHSFSSRDPSAYWLNRRGLVESKRRMPWVLDFWGTSVSYGILLQPKIAWTGTVVVTLMGLV